MNNDRQKILTDYISYLYTTGRTYDTVGKYIKHVTDFIEIAKEENLPVNITMGRSYTDSSGSRQVGIILEFDSWNSKIINDKLADTINRIFELK